MAPFFFVTTLFLPPPFPKRFKLDLIISIMIFVFLLFDYYHNRQGSSHGKFHFARARAVPCESLQFREAFGHMALLLSSIASSGISFDLGG